MQNYEKVLGALLLAAFVSNSTCAEIIPADRRTDWAAGVAVGVPGGIPDRTTIGATVDAAVYGAGSV